MKFAITDTSGKRRVYRMRSFEEMTLRDWIAINGTPMPEDNLAATYALLSRATTCPERTLKRLPVADFEKLCAIAGDAMSKAAKAQQADPPTEFTHDGITYAVPQDLEQVSFGQWFDFAEVHLPQVEREVDAYAASIAILCAPKGGEYDADRTPALMQSFLDLPLLTALSVCAFFFDRSERYRGVMLQHFNSLKTRALLSLGPVARLSSNATEASPA